LRKECFARRKKRKSWGITQGVVQNAEGGWAKPWFGRGHGGNKGTPKKKPVMGDRTKTETVFYKWVEWILLLTNEIRIGGKKGGSRDGKEGEWD